MAANFTIVFSTLVVFLCCIFYLVKHFGQPWLFDVLYKSCFTYLQLLMLKNEGSHSEPPCHVCALLKKNSGAQQRGLQHRVCKVLELYPQASQVRHFPLLTYIDLMHLETSSVMHPSFSGLLRSYTLIRATQLMLIKLQLVSRLHYPNQGSPHLIQSHLDAASTASVTWSSTCSCL